MNLKRRISTIVLFVMISLCFQLTTANADVLNVYLLAGQSNMEGQAYTYNSAATANWNIPTMEFLLSGSPAATTYLANMPHGFKGSLCRRWNARAVVHDIYTAAGTAFADYGFIRCIVKCCVCL